MSVKREDLMAAATAGVLHFGEIDPLLIFLAQREAIVRKLIEPREKIVNRKRSHLLYYLGGVLAIAVATLFGVLFSTEAVGSLGLVAVLWFSLLYALCAIGAAAWFDRRGRKVAIGLFAVSVMALMPVAVFALQRVMRT